MTYGTDAIRRDVDGLAHVLHGRAWCPPSHHLDRADRQAHECRNRAMSRYRAAVAGKALSLPFVRVRRGKHEGSGARRQHCKVVGKAAARVYARGRLRYLPIQPARPAAPDDPVPLARGRLRCLAPGTHGAAGHEPADARAPRRRVALERLATAEWRSIPIAADRARAAAGSGRRAAQRRTSRSQGSQLGPPRALRLIRLALSRRWCGLLYFGPVSPALRAESILTE